MDRPGTSQVCAPGYPASASGSLGYHGLVPFSPLPRSGRGPERQAPGPKEVSAAVRPYEVMVIFDVETDEADIRQQVERAGELVRSSGGTPGQVQNWGRRSLAYEVKHHSEGYYVLFEAVAEPETMAAVDRFFALEDSVLRHKVLRQPEGEAGRGLQPRGLAQDRAPKAQPAQPSEKADAGSPAPSEPPVAPATAEPTEPEPQLG